MLESSRVRHKVPWSDAVNLGSRGEGDWVRKKERQRLFVPRGTGSVALLRFNWDALIQNIAMDRPGAT